MIKRTVEISREAAHVSLKHDQIVLKRGDAVVATIPSEDLGILVVDHPQATFSAAALARSPDFFHHEEHEGHEGRSAPVNTCRMNGFAGSGPAR